MSFTNKNIELQKILFSEKVNLYVLRLDQIDSEVSGNKWFKLKYNIAEALKQKHYPARFQFR